MSTEQPMPVLDDVARMQSVDKRNMLRLINDLPEQFETALGIGRNYVVEPPAAVPNVVYIASSGDSKTAGEMALEAVSDEIDVPVIVDSSGRLPKCVGENSLVLVTDYTGKSHAGVRAYREAKARGAEVICITSGGKLLESVIKDGGRVIKIPPGQPARTAIGFLFTPIVVIFEQMGLVSGMIEKLSYGVRLMKNVREAIRFEYPTARNVAKQIALGIFDKLTVIYAASDYRSAIASRWKSQFNLNSKAPAYMSAFPDAIDAEVSGWEQAEKPWNNAAMIFLNDSIDRGETADLLSAGHELLNRFNLVDVDIKGNTTIEKLLYGLYLGDFVSYYLSLLYEVNPSLTESVSLIESRLAGEEPPAEQ